MSWMPGFDVVRIIPEQILIASKIQIVSVIHEKEDKSKNATKSRPMNPAVISDLE